MVELKWYKMKDRKPVKGDFSEDGWIFCCIGNKVTMATVHGLIILKKNDYWARKTDKFNWGDDVSLPSGVKTIKKKISSKTRLKNKKRYTEKKLKDFHAKNKLNGKETMTDKRFKIYKAKRGFKLAKQVSPVEWHGYLSEGLQYKRGKRYEIAISLKRLDVHCYASRPHCDKIIKELYG